MERLEGLQTVDGNFWVEKQTNCGNCQRCQEYALVDAQHPLCFEEPNEIPSPFPHKEMGFYFSYDVDMFVKPVNCPFSPFFGEPL